MNHDTAFMQNAHEYRGSHLSLSDCVVNEVRGIVHSQHMGLSHPTVRINVGRRVNLHIRLPTADDRCFFPGRQIIAMIPATAVRLEAGLFRRSRQRLNRWYGRIVLIQRLDERPLITAKIHGETWTLTSMMPIVGAAHCPRTWDSVNVVVDPHKIAVFPCRRKASVTPNNIGNTDQIVDDLLRHGIIV